MNNTLREEKKKARQTEGNNSTSGKQESTNRKPLPKRACTCCKQESNRNRLKHTEQHNPSTTTHLRRERITKHRKQKKIKKNKTLEALATLTSCHDAEKQCTSQHSTGEKRKKKKRIKRKYASKQDFTLDTLQTHSAINKTER